MYYYYYYYYQEFHKLRRQGLTAAFHKLDTNSSGYVRIASCARLLSELSRPSISMFNWEMSRYTSTKRTSKMLQSWWEKVVDETRKDEYHSNSHYGTENNGGGGGSSRGSGGGSNTSLNGIEEVDEEKDEKEENNGNSRANQQHNRARSTPMNRPVDDLIPLDAFCDMMISVEQAKEVLQRKKKMSFQQGYFYNDNNILCKKLLFSMKHYLWDWFVAGIVIINTIIIIVEADIDSQLENGQTDNNHYILLCENL